MHSRLFVLSIFLLLTVTTLSQENDNIAFVGIREGNLLWIENNTETVIAEYDYAILHYYPLDSNNQGDVLYQEWSRNPSETPHALYIYDGEVSTRLVTDFVIDCPALFVDDEHIAYVSNQTIEEYSDETGVYRRVPVLKHNILTDTIEEISTLSFPLAGGGGGGTDILPDLIAEEEHLSHGYFTVPNFFALQDTTVIAGDFGICGGGLKTIIDNEQTILSLRGTTALSPSAQRAAVINREADEAILRIYDLNSGNSLRLTMTGYLDFTLRYALYWADDGMIYLTSSEMMDLPSEFTSELAEAVSEELGWDWSRSNRVYIYQVNPTSGRINEVHRAENIWAIMRLESRDGYLYWAEIPDGTSVINGYLNGDFEENRDYDYRNDYLLPNIYRMPLAGGEVELVLENLQRFITVAIPE